MRYIQLPAFILLLFLNSCVQETTTEEGPKIIVLKESSDILPISSFTGSVDYIELKLSGTGKTLGEVLSVKKIDDDWMLKHRMTGRTSFMRFNQSGEFITELPREGEKRVTNPEDIIAYENGYAMLAGNGIHAVSKDGKYQRLLSDMKADGSRFFELGKRFYILNETGNGDLLTSVGTKSSKTKLNNVLPDMIQRMIYTSVEPIGKDHIDFYSVLSDTVFTRNKNEMKVAVVFTGDSIPTFAQLFRSLDKMEAKDRLKYLHETEHVILRNYLENSDFMFLTFWVGSKSTTAIVNKQNGEIRYFGQGVNDIDGGVWDEAFYLTSKNELVIPISAYKVGVHKIRNKKAKGFDQLQKRISSSDNPVLMCCKLK